MQQGYAELKTGLEHRHGLHVVRANLSDAEFVNGADPQFAMRSLLALRVGLTHYPCNKMICIEGDPAEYIFLLIAGVVRTCRSFEDGNRSIVCFHVPGELFGFNGELTHSLSAEAASNTTMLLLKRSAVLAMAARDSRIANFLLANTTKELRRLQEHAVLISRNAQCRLATFLIDLSVRTGKTDTLDLPMSHRDIADYVGLTIETRQPRNHRIRTIWLRYQDVSAIADVEEPQCAHAHHGLDAIKDSNDHGINHHLS